MDKIQLLHPDNKKAISMDRTKYGLLKDSFLACLKLRKHSSFKELSDDVEKDLRKRRKKIQGKLEWNLFWVTLDLEARKEICRDKTKSPFVYSIA
ncbi:MAG TPA: hypothetical protein VKI61_15870 [Chitinophagaceae bacterium]|jgi:hypothetical protein|nr:hypothetical protein [Chitinophagaceae bacterium]